ncbi:DUF4249 domain-containing protein [Labilibacter marinus]|uniref:DUF4249 domain-containing protein n=1 Tax=Labilibacter marinus TaxID=1477105 RepID=UPI00082E5847|nr:DUF4249 domain-containing protein [Labilibacter marinus]
MRCIVCAALIALLSSCFKEVDIDIPYQEPKLVVGSYFTHNEKIEAILTSTVPAYDTLYNLKDIANASVEFDGEIYPLRHVHDSLYQSDIKGQYGVNYKIIASVKGYETVFAEDFIPRPVDFSIDKYVPNANVDYEGENISSITITLKDVPKEPTFFELRMKSTHSYFSNDKDHVSTYYTDLSSQDIVVRNEGVVNLSVNKVGLLFSNELIRDENYTLTYYFYNWVDDDYNNVDHVSVELRSVSEDYFQFKKRLYLNLDNQVGDLWDGTGNPIEAYTNIKNGCGIFAGYSQVSHSKKL